MGDQSGKLGDTIKFLGDVTGESLFATAALKINDSPAINYYFETKKINISIQTGIRINNIYHYVMQSWKCFIYVLLVKTRGIPSNSVDGNLTNLPPSDLVHLSGPVTEDAITRVLQQRSAVGENYVCTKNS